MPKLPRPHRLLALCLLLLSSAVVAGQLSRESPQEFVARYYAALTTKDFESLSAFYAGNEARPTAERLAADFEWMESITVRRWLGVQSAGDLAHVLVVLRVTEKGVEAAEYNFAQHDLKRSGEGWQLVSADALPAAEQQALLRLWQRQRELLRAEPALKAEVEWVQAQRKEAQARRRQRVPVAVD